MDSDVKDIFEVEREPASSGTPQLSKEAIMGSIKVRGKTNTPAETSVYYVSTGTWCVDIDSPADQPMYIVHVP